MSLYRIVLSLHGLVGLVALVAFWIAGFARKGSPLHRAAGKAYLVAMLGVVAAALLLSLRIAWLHGAGAGVFMGYLVLITATSLWRSWRAPRDKRDVARYAGRVFRTLAWLNLAGGAAVLALGLLWPDPRHWVLVGFSTVGLLAGRRMLRFAAAPPTHPRWWLEEHVGGMLGNGVATHIAFLSIGLPKLLPMLAGPVLQNVAWLGPLAIATGVRVVRGRRSKPFAKPSAGVGTAGLA
jgi:hypothetical protein